MGEIAQFRSWLSIPYNYLTDWWDDVRSHDLTSDSHSWPLRQSEQSVDSQPRQIGNFDAWRAAGTGHRIKYWLGGRTSAAVDCRRQVLVCVRVPPQSVCLLLARWYRIVPNHPYPSEGSHRLYGKENISSFTARISFSRERSLPSPLSKPNSYPMHFTIVDFVILVLLL